MGEFVSEEGESFDFLGNFYCLRVKIDLCKPLKNAMSIIRGKYRQFLLVKYQRLPDWCTVCGMLGHTNKEHGDGIHPLSTLVFIDLSGDWNWFPNARLGPGHGRGRGIGRGGRMEG